MMKIHWVVRALMVEGLRQAICLFVLQPHFALDVKGTTGRSIFFVSMFIGTVVAYLAARLQGMRWRRLFALSNIFRVLLWSDGIV